MFRIYCACTAISNSSYDPNASIFVCNVVFFFLHCIPRTFHSVIDLFLLFSFFFFVVFFFFFVRRALTGSEFFGHFSDILHHRFNFFLTREKHQDVLPGRNAERRLV